MTVKVEWGKCRDGAGSSGLSAPVHLCPWASKEKPKSPGLTCKATQCLPAKPNLLWGPGNWVGLDLILPSLTLPRADAASAANHQVPVGTAWLGDGHKAWEPHEQLHQVGQH
ncbi:unnamed protein product [Rangifer tarandus platyrhynchus]|uniref:Uncharacterized protein n=1 Tax=Rangifer tarandus platyrhynchus TaxID=3082113 RepID=A0AC59YJJ3_RANTA